MGKQSIRDMIPNKKIIQALTKRVQLVQWEVQHDPLAHEGVAMVALPGKHRQPHPHAVGAAVEPQAGRQVGLVGVGATGEPNGFAARGQDSWQRLQMF